MAAEIVQAFIEIIALFTDLPAWLALSGNADTVADLVRDYVPELASGALALSVGPFERLGLKNKAGCWTGTYVFDVASTDHTAQTLLVDAALFAPNVPLPADVDAPATESFGSPGWRGWFPEQRLLLTYRQPETDLSPTAQLADPDQARPILEQALRTQAEGYDDVQIESCAVKILDHKPGSTTIFRYQLTYPAAQADRPWQNVIFGKYYADGEEDKGENAYAGMRSLWHSPLAHSDAVTIAEALGYITEFHTVLQGMVPEECNLEDIEREAVRGNDPAVWAKLTAFARKAGVGLAAMHRSGVQHEQRYAVKRLRGNVSKQIEILSAPFPELMNGIKQLMVRVDALLAATPADADVPSHGAFRPEQVLINGEQIGFIDFDRFCMSEPSYDLYRFRAELMDYGCSMRRHGYPDEATMRERIGQLAAVNEAFLSAYEAHAPISRQRLAVWETLYYMKEVLVSWSKARLEDRTARIFMLETRLQELGIIER